MTRGRKMLLALLQRTTGRVVAAKLGVAPSRVSEWSSGLRKPSARDRAALAFTFAIPLDSWDEALPFTRR